MTLLPWHAPYDPEWIFGFLRARAVAGIETFSAGRYTRSFSLAGHRGLIITFFCRSSGCSSRPHRRR